MMSLYLRDAIDLIEFKNRFDPVYFEKLDPGETESLTHLLLNPQTYLLCSADKIVFRVLAALSKGEQGISLEEVLNRIGLTRNLPFQFSKAFREEWTKKGFEESLWGIGLKKK